MEHFSLLVSKLASYPPLKPTRGAVDFLLVSEEALQHGHLSLELKNVPTHVVNYLLMHIGLNLSGLFL